MKLGYITKQDPNDVLAYSGTHFNMFESLKKSFEHVIPFGPVKESLTILPKAYGRLLTFGSNKVYKYQYNVGLAKRAAKKIENKIRQTSPDVLLASLMSPEVAYIESNLPLYITTDATFPLLRDLYQSHSKLHPKSIKEAIHLEEKAFNKATKLLLPLDWLADSAMKHYGIPSSKIEVIPYGSNLGIKIDKSEVDTLIDSRIETKKLNLLFVGVRWEEKGGPFALNVIDELQKMGIDSELIIAGSDPEIPPDKPYLKKVGFFDKSNPKEKEAFIELYKKAHFFIMPTTAECVGMSFIEAASVGLPAIGTLVGGVPEAIKHSKTGFVKSNDQSAKEVAEWISKTRSKETTYREISINAYRHQSEKMSWANWANSVKQLIG